MSSGDVFAIGQYTVTLVASDGSSNSANITDTFTVTVSDNTDPVLTGTNITIEATSSAGAVPGVNWVATTAQANLECSTNAPTITYAAPLGNNNAVVAVTSASTFPIGTTTVTATGVDEAIDPANSNAADPNTGTTTFTVLVRDTTVPVFVQNTLIADIAQNSECGLNGAAAGGKAITWVNPTVTEAVATTYTYTTNGVGGNATVSSGDVFVIGEYTVTLVVSDGSTLSDNITDTFTVTVSDNTAPSLTGTSITIEATSSAGAAPGGNLVATTAQASLE